MVIQFPVQKSSQARLVVARGAERRSPSFGYTLTLSMALSLMLWAGVAAALVRL